MNRTKIASVATLSLLAASCSAEIDEQGSFAQQTQEVKLMPKPGVNIAESSFSEAGRDIAQLNGYTFYGADFDGNDANDHDGSAHLFRDNQPLRSYRVETPYPGSFFGRIIGLSENYLAAKVQEFPFGPGNYRDAVLVAGRAADGEFESCGDLGPNGELPNCVSCTVGPSDGSTAPDFTRLTCSPTSNVQILRPSTFTDTDRVLGLDLSKNELVVVSNQKLALYRASGSDWKQIATYLLGTNESYVGPVALSLNRLAVLVRKDGVLYIKMFARSSSTGRWHFSVRVHPPGGESFRSDAKLDLSGNSLVVGDSQNTFFIDLMRGGPADWDDGVTRACTLNQGAYDVAISGSNAVIATRPGLPMTFRRGTHWRLQGGLADGLFPRDVNNAGFPTLASLWGAAIDGDDVAIGWRNFAGTTPLSATGAALGFSFKEYDCGYLRPIPGGQTWRVDPLYASSVDAPAFFQFPDDYAVDGSVDTRWMAPMTPGTKLTLDLGELRMLSHLEITWGTTYSDDFSVLVSEDGNSYFTIDRVSGSGDTQVVDLRDNEDAFGRYVQLDMHGFDLKPNTGDWGVAIKEIQAFRRVHESCNELPSGPSMACEGDAPSHICTFACGGQASGQTCYCDHLCERYNDCCSFDGAHRGSEYVRGVADRCDF